MSEPDRPPSEPSRSRIAASAPALGDREMFTSATYRALANSLPLSVLIKTCDGRRVFANDTYLKWRNLRWEDVSGKVDAELFPEEIAKQYTEDDEQVLQTGQSSHAVEQAQIAGGDLGWVERIKSPIYDASGKLLGLQILFWDVTARIHAEQTSRFEQSLLNTLLRNIPDSIYFKDLQSRFIRVSKAMAEQFGFTHPEQMQGHSDADVLTHEHAVKTRREELSVIQSGIPLVDRIERETHPDQDDTWCMSTKMPLQDESGEVIGTFGISRDITALKRSEVALQEAVRLADAANRAKSEFLANMSHELRTPMNALVGMADLLAQTDLDDGQREYVDTIRRSSDSLMKLLNDILDFSKIEARKMELESVVFSLAYEIQAALSTLRYQAAKKNLQLKLDVAESLPSHFLGDPGRLRQVLVNLIGNAVKFTDHGSVTVSLSEAPGSTQADSTESSWTEEGSNRAAENPSRGDAEGDSPQFQRPTVPVRVSVTDTGIGIPKSQHAAILAPFTQADTSTTRRFGGTGLGLSISRQLVELMGGELSLRSEVGVGTTFHFDLRLPVADGKHSRQHDDDLEEDLGGENLSPAEPLRVLVAEDGVTNQHVIAGLLRSLGHECSIASDGRETLEMWRSDAFDLVLMDMHMPVMDGLEATREIRQHEFGTDRHIPIIALTAAAMAEDAKLCHDAGMDDYLTKPIRRRRLQQVLATIPADPNRPRSAANQTTNTPANTEATETTAATAAGMTERAPPASVPQPTSVAPNGNGSSDILVLSEEHAGCLDLDSARSRIPGGVSGVLRLAAVFREECQALVRQLQTDLSLGDNDAARRNAHTLKGACGLLGAQQLLDAAIEIEGAAQQQELGTPQRADELSQLLETESGRVLAAVAELLQKTPPGKEK